MDPEDKIKIELLPWEARHLNTGVKYLIESQLKGQNDVKNVPPDVVKSLSYLIAWRSFTFDKR
jgi:hypothetical protein